jgi:hypothetical protein
MQRIDKHISAYRIVLCNAVTSSTIPTVFYVGSVQSAYKRSKFRSKLVQAVTSQLPVGQSHGSS